MLCEMLHWKYKQEWLINRIFVVAVVGSDLSNDVTSR